MIISVRILLTSSHHIIVQASHDQTGSHIIVAAQNTVVREVRIIGANLTYQAFNKASSIVSQFFFKTFI
ncbi:hypothetical protein HOF65_00705 [bacterium]|nr:hypothetical protein [bacterium]MBT3852565.1 hypothetical protein [bacterium]MBT4632498.1 hypothetical protein [bacterium]